MAHEAHHDPVARAHAVDPGAHLLHGPGRLVPEHDRDVTAPGAVERRDVAVADGARADGHPHLVLLRRIERDLLHGERLPEGVADGGERHRRAA